MKSIMHLQGDLEQQQRINSEMSDQIHQAESEVSGDGELARNATRSHIQGDVDELKKIKDKFLKSRLQQSVRQASHW